MTALYEHVRKSVLLWYSPGEMYELVTSVQDYPAFLPWCDKAEVLQRHDDGITARLGLPTWACTTPSRHATRMCPAPR